MPGNEWEGLLRDLAPRVLGGLVRRYGYFDECEDAVQEALLEAAVKWPAEGVPDNPRAWLHTVASRRLIDLWRSDEARKRRELQVTLQEPPLASVTDEDDTLKLLFLCCHDSLSPASQIALTLRAVGGLTTAQIARAFFVPEATMAQRISRAKATIKGEPFRMHANLAPVLHVLYLIFNEGYTASSGEALHDVTLSAEAIRLTRMLPGDGEVAGLLALMLFTDARRPARTSPDGALVPLAEQDRTLWDRASIAEAQALLTDALANHTIGPYQLQAAIAGVHAEAPSADETDWTQILALYGLLARMAPNPMVTLNHAVALAMVKGPQAGLDLLSTLDEDPRMAKHHRLAAVRAHLLEMSGEPAAAREAYELAAKRTTSLPEQRYLLDRAARLA
ncbi:RNA polymerase sigma factor [Allorhizocola rhizosphaerae]|uniref:RNA polymerase sigma factor n=1 Tax=Allorhizocola rhizosphaerae TaxID=1872709 RepID=UPI000E3CE2E3|nr:DUF6596 domain-containing protein [Allorhizocola rhizosphaerae]